MDILFRLRFLLWVLVVGLWGALAYEFLQDDLVYQPPRLTTFRPAFEHEDQAVRASPGPLPVIATVARPEAPPALTPAVPSQVEGIPPAVALAKPPPHAKRPALSKRAAAIPHEWDEERAPAAKDGETRSHQHEEEPASGGELPKAPAGFQTARTAHFIIFSERDAVPEQFLDTLETLHSNLMLDLAAFAPWARTERVTLYLFQTQAAYQRFTGRPGWSGGSSSVERRTLYLYRSSEVTGILAHELTHVYFDSFFAGGKADPLWLSEGMATFIQIQRGLASPNWIRPNLEKVVDNKGYGLKEMMAVSSLSGVSDGSVRLWYTEAYSVVRFLIRSKWFVSYYQFCKNLRDGRPFNEALYKAYGMPYNRLSSLELAWHYDLKTHAISNLAMSQTTTAE